MGLISSLISLGIGAAAVQGIASADDVRRGWMTHEEKKEFDQLNARDGIHTERIVDIARRCHVKTNKYGVIPSGGYRKCLQYVRKYANSEDDIDRFIANWKKTFQQQLRNLPNKVKESDDAKWYDSYAHTLQSYDLTDSKLHTYEVTHWKSLSKEEHLKRMQRISRETALKHVLYQPPILRWSDMIRNAYTEFWTVYIPKEAGNVLRNKREFHATYEVCAAHLGYDAEL